MEKAIASPKRTAELLKQYGLNAKKSLGQNFLMDTNILDKMIEAGKIDKSTTVIEIGPGIGALTEQLLYKAKEVFAFEIDQRFIPLLETELGDKGKLKVINQDILEVNLKDYLPEQVERLAVVANLPYYITTPIIMHLLDSGLAVDCFVLMMQKEVAQRMTAQPHSKAYGSLTIAIDLVCESEIAFTVPKTVFNPQPRVDSAVLVLKRRKELKVPVDSIESFEWIVRQCFTQRRKTLWNNLTQAFGKAEMVKVALQQALKEAQIPEQSRAEQLSIQEFARLYEAIRSKDDLRQSMKAQD